MKKRLILFGTGVQGKAAYERFKDDHTIIGFADNNPALFGKRIFDTDIIPGNELLSYLDGDTDILVCSSLYYLEIGKQLNDMGITRYYVFYDDEVYVGRVEDKDGPAKVCSRCVMDDSSDKYILFKENGECNYCTNALKRSAREYFPNEEGKRKLDELINRIKTDGKGKKYDCVMGISGGLDSSYLLYKGYKWGLRILAIHIDDGFDTEISKRNLDKLVESTGVDYEVIRPDSEQFNDLTLAYMRAGVPNIAVPQDNILFAFIYRKMKEYGIKFFLSGGNFALESILQKGNSHNYLDLTNLFDIHSRFGKKGVDRLEFISEDDMNRNRKELGIESPRPLNYIEYDRDRALNELHEFCGFEYYGSKHLENIFTAFAQLYWFPSKFGVDKRRSHFSSMIISNQMDRDSAIKELESPLYDEKMMTQYISIIKERLGIDDVEFEKLINNPPCDHDIYAVKG